MTREDMADAALYDFATRPGATAKKVMRQMMEAGFTRSEVLMAVERAK